jgi:hypothetical protein
MMKHYVVEPVVIEILMQTKVLESCLRKHVLVSMHLLAMQLVTSQDLVQQDMRGVVCSRRGTSGHGDGGNYGSGNENIANHVEFPER